MPHISLAEPKKPFVMKTSKILSSLLILIIMSHSAFNNAMAQTSITGKVKEQSKGKLLSGASVLLKDSAGVQVLEGVTTDASGSFTFNKVDPGTYQLFANHSGFKDKTQTVKVRPEQTKHVTIVLKPVVKLQESVVLDQYELIESESEVLTSPGQTKSPRRKTYKKRSHNVGVHANYNSRNHNPQWNTESYDHIVENEFKLVSSNPLSTFSIDVDAASYSNIRRFVNNGQMPPKDAVRIEEMINYFNYDYAQPKGDDPFSITTEMSDCPWNEKHRLVHIGLQGEKLATEELPPSNLVFLLDVSGSMRSPNKLPLLKKSFRLLTDQLREEDRVAIVVYAGAAGLVLNSTTGDQKEKITDALSKLRAGGSTAGGAGIKLAYKVAMENFIENGNNRVILATDGDFNIGVSSDGAMTRLIEEKRESGVSITCLGFGMGNYKDSKMETIADKGNGNYAYIDNIMEAKKVLVSEMGGTMHTIAKDVKLQIEFNPKKVASYKLIGYENRMLNEEDFNDDTKDAGELGSGHSVTALYEIVPVGVEDDNTPSVDPLRYQDNESSGKANSKELMTVKFRYKSPKESKSKLITHHLKDRNIDPSKTTDNFMFSAAVAEFGMLLRGSEHKGDASYSQVLTMARKAKGKDEHGYRAEFIRMVEMCELQANK